MYVRRMNEIRHESAVKLNEKVVHKVKIVIPTLVEFSGNEVFLKYLKKKHNAQ